MTATFKPNLMSPRGGEWRGSMRDAELPLLHALARIVIEGTAGVGSYLIVDGDDAFVQFAGTRGDTELWCEAVSNYYLPPARRLEEAEIARLHELGFASPTRTPWDEPGKRRCPNHHRHIDVGTETRLYVAMVMALGVLRDVYGCTPDAELRITLRMEVWPASSDAQGAAA